MLFRSSFSLRQILRGSIIIFYWPTNKIYFLIIYHFSYFYSALSISEGVEGKYYVWSYEELNNLLKDDIKYFENKYEITENGNFEGNNILVEKNLISDKDKNNLDLIKNKLLEVRKKINLVLFHLKEIIMGEQWVLL